MGERERTSELHEFGAVGRDAVVRATELLQRVRLADPDAGLWEAADVQWWWRKSRRSDELEQTFWADSSGPVAAVLLTDFGHSWQCDVIVAPGVSSIALPTIWARAAEFIESVGSERVEVPARDDDSAFIDLLQQVGFLPSERSRIAWMNAEDCPDVASVPDGFVIADREASGNKSHPMARRNGDAIESRLRECSLYDPTLDLAIETIAGEVAGVSLYWFDPVTKVGMLEPMRVDDEYQRRGLARAMLTNGLDRLARRGARRIKVSYSTDVAAALYEGVGFRATAASTWYARGAQPGS